MAPLDWVFLSVLLFSLLVGAWRGLVYELISLASWFAAFVLAQWFAPAVAGHLPMAGAGEPLRYAAAFVVVFVGSLFAGSLIAFVLKKLISAVGMSPADRALGALFGLVRGAVLLLAVVVVVGMTPLHTAGWWQDALGPRVGNVVLAGIKPVLPQEFGKYLP